jgi:hypothetical protein
MSDFATKAKLTVTPEFQSSGGNDVDVQLPAEVLASHGETAQAITEYLQENGYVSERQRVTAFDLHCAVGELVTVTDIELEIE